MKKINHDEINHDQTLLNSLVGLPQRILQLHEVDELSPLILHELGHDSHFGLNKAVYLVDNPDFDSLRGVAGFCKDECSLHKADVWQDPYSFAHDMSSGQFHQQIKQFNHSSITRNHDQCSQEGLVNLGKTLGLNNPSCCIWNTRHGNHGILLFEGRESMVEKQKSLLSQIIALLSFC